MISHPNRARKTKPTASAHVREPTHEHDYSALLNGVRASFAAAITGRGRLFQTNADGLYEMYLDGMLSERQAHDCRTCRKFIEAYGGIVAIDESGDTIPVMWNPNSVPDFYRASFSAMHVHVKRARIESPFLSDKTIWGTPVTGTWSHMAAEAPAALVFRNRLLTPGQAMAAAKENFRTVATALSEFTAPMLDEALRLLQADALARSERFIGPVKWLRALHDRSKGRKGENILWRAIASAPEGYCHPKASVIGPLLDDIAVGMPFANIKARFEAKIHPLIYQRPQAAPAAGNIKAAEEIVAKLGIAPSLERRFARVDELQTIWTPAAPRNAALSAGVFGHIKPKDVVGVVQSVDMPAVTMTWDKFARTIMPNAEQMQILVPAHGRFIALTTAVHADAPPILKWDRDDARNPVAWYVYPTGSPARQWGLAGGSWAKVLAAAPFPTMWGAKPSPFLGEGVMLAIEGACDTNTASGNALFPEYLRDDLHAVRATIEAYSRGAQVGGREGAVACGYDVRKGQNSADCNLRVYTGGAWTTYWIDRWD